MTIVTPSVDTTIFPRINLYKNFKARAVRRDVNGRIFGQFGDLPIDEPNRYPAVDGSLEFDELLPFSIDLGPDVSDQPYRVIDLRNPEVDYLSNPNQIVTTYDLNPLDPSIDNTQFYPVVNSGQEFPDLLPFPIDLGPDVATSITTVVDLRIGNDAFDFNPLEGLAPPADGSVRLLEALPFPIDLGDTTSAIVNIYDLTLGNSTYNLDPLIATIDEVSYYPAVGGGVLFSNALPFPVDLGPDITTSTTNKFELRLGDTSYDLN